MGALTDLGNRNRPGKQFSWANLDVGVSKTKDWEYKCKITLYFREGCGVNRNDTITTMNSVQFTSNLAAFEVKGVG